MGNLQNRLNLHLAKVTQVKLLLAWDSRVDLLRASPTLLFCGVKTDVIMLKTEIFMLKC